MQRRACKGEFRRNPRISTQLFFFQLILFCILFLHLFLHSFLFFLTNIINRVRVVYMYFQTDNTRRMIVVEKTRAPKVDVFLFCFVFLSFWPYLLYV